MLLKWLLRRTVVTAHGAFFPLTAVVSPFPAPLPATPRPSHTPNPVRPCQGIVSGESLPTPRTRILHSTTRVRTPPVHCLSFAAAPGTCRPEPVALSPAPGHAWPGSDPCDSQFLVTTRFSASPSPSVIEWSSAVFAWPRTNGPAHKSIASSPCISKLASRPEPRLFYCCFLSQTFKNNICPSRGECLSSPSALAGSVA